MVQMIRPQHIKATDPFYANLADQLMAMSRQQQAAVTPTNGQRVFDVPFEFKQDGIQLQVFINGMKQEAGLTYTEVDSNTVEFVEPLFSTDLVVFRIQGMGGTGVTYVADHGHIYREEVQGVIDGVNKVFRISKLPIAGSELVFVNGIMQESPGDFLFTGDGMEITFVDAPIPGDKILVNYDIKLG